MHHYTSVVGPSMPDCEADVALGMWQERIPQMAFHSEVVLNPMLAISALHLHAHTGHNPILARTLRRYLDRALQHHRHALDSGDKKLSEATWLSAVILSNINWLLARHRDGESARDYEMPLQMWKMLSGVGTLFTQQRQVLDRMGYGWYGEKLSSSLRPREQLSFTAQTQLRFIEEDLRFLFAAFKVPQMAMEDAGIYQEVREYIFDQYRAFFSGTPAQVLRWGIGTMLSRCNTGFPDKLERHDPLSMALLARLLVLMHAIEETWWMNGIGEYRVLENDIPGMETLMPLELQWAMKWPLSILDGTFKLCRE